MGHQSSFHGIPYLLRCSHVLGGVGIQKGLWVSSLRCERIHTSSGHRRHVLKQQRVSLCSGPGPVVPMSKDLEQANLPVANVSPNFPMSTMVYFQCVLATIAVIIVFGTLA